jgi:CubicO group peptidase (beta-lactamase class C family)
MEATMTIRKSIRSIFFLFLLTCLFSIADVYSQPDNFAIYTDLAPDSFMTEWWVTGPIAVSEDTTEGKNPEKQLQVFEQDAVDAEIVLASVPSGSLEIHGTAVPWKKVSAKVDVIDLFRQVAEKEYAYVYATAQIVMSEESRVLLGVGSDDGIKIWVNGELVHKYWIGRPTRIDEDLVQVVLKRGSNSILMKVQNQQYDWSFVCRRLGPSSFSRLLTDNAGRGNLDNVNVLLANGADVNARIDPGVTALHVAQIKGRQELVRLLLEHGADSSIAMPSKEKLVESLFQRAMKPGYPGAAVLVSQNGKILFEKGYGLANRQENIPIIPSTTFRIGSITKQFIAAAILKLAEDGRLSISDKLSKFFPDFPRGDEVTVYHLLTHTSGIHSFTSVPDFIEKVTGAITQQEMIDNIKGYGYDFDPGKSFLYNNSGFYLLGCIIEKVTGMSYGAYLNKTFFKPLGMAHTGVYSKDVAFEREAIGYSYENIDVATALDWNMDFAGGAGSLYSNVRDLYQWNEAVFSGKVLSPKSLEAAFTPARLSNGEVADAQGGGHYGFGWALGSLRGCEEISHGGGLNGFASFLTRFPQDSFTVVVLSNSAPTLPNLNPSEVAHEIAEIYLYDHMEPQQVYSTTTLQNKDILDDYVGQYDYQSANMTITRKGDRLFAQLAGQAEFEIFPKGDDEFYWKVVEASVKFLRDENGKVNRAAHTQNGRTFEAPRIEQKEVVPVNAAVLQKYVGEYELAPGATAGITLEGEQLYIQVKGQPRFEIYASSPTEFFLKVVNAKITFLQDDSGLVNALQLDQGPVHNVAKKIK